MPSHLHSVCKVLIGNKLNQLWTKRIAGSVWCSPNTMNRQKL